MTDDRTEDARAEDALRRVLSIEAQQVQPTGDGLSRIQQRVGARHSRMSWLRPVLAGAAAVIVVGGAVGGYAVAHNGNGNQTLKVSDSGSPTPPVVTSGDYPTAAIFPFTNVTDEQNWEQEYAQGSMPFASDPTAVTESWIEHYLLQKGDFSFSAGTDASQSNVTVSRTVGTDSHVVTVVHLVKYDNAWLVTGASDPAGELQFSDPAANTAVTSPLTVDGPAYGVDEQATVEIRNAETPDLFGQASTGPFGSGSAQWSASVPFTATSDAGVVVATVASAADGKVGTLAAEKVTFGSNGHAVSTAGAAYAVEGGTIVMLDPSTGDSEGPVPGVTGTVVEARELNGALYYTVRVGDCLPTLYSIPLAGGTPKAVASAEDPDYGIVGFDITPDGTKLAYFESSGCNQSMAGKGKLVFVSLADDSTRTIAFPSEPPAIFGDPVWESDGVHVDAFVRTGMQGYLARYDATQGDSQTPSTNACEGFNPGGGIAEAALTTGPDGTLWFAWQTGTGIQVVSCANGQAKVAFTTKQNDTPTAISVNSQGEVLLTGTSGNAWTWQGTNGAQAEELHGAPGATYLTW
jgi:hypothetical protein